MSNGADDRTRRDDGADRRRHIRKNKLARELAAPVRIEACGLHQRLDHARLAERRRWGRTRLLGRPRQEREDRRHDSGDEFAVFPPAPGEHRHRAAHTHDPARLAKCLHSIAGKGKRVDPGHDVEAPIGERQRLHLPDLDSRARQPLPRDRDQPLRRIQSRDLGTHCPRQHQRAAGAASDIEQPCAAADARLRQQFFEHRSPGRLLHVRPIPCAGAPQLALDFSRAHPGLPRTPRRRLKLISAGPPPRELRPAPPAPRP